MSDEVLTEVRGRTLLVELNRPHARNAIDNRLAQGLADAMRRLDDDPSLCAGVLAGRGAGFCSGMDLKAFAAEGPPTALVGFITEASAKPLIAAVEGFAIAGGLELALACDLIVAARGARVGIPEVRVGLVAAGGALFRLARQLPYGRAMELALTADTIDAETACQLGLVTRLAEPGGALEAALDIAERIGRNAPLAVVTSKRLLRNCAGQTEAEFWAAQRAPAHAIFESADALEGANAFAEKREPVWTGA